jgi:hypothetical protein
MAEREIETFESSGYDLSWTEVGTGTTNENYATSNVGSPANWGDQCCYLDNVGSDLYSYRASGADAVIYHRMQLQILSETLSNGQSTPIFIWAANSLLIIAAELLIYQPGDGQLQFVLTAAHDGDEENFFGESTDIQLDTVYDVEFMWNATANTWDWWIDGVRQANNIDSSYPITSGGTLSATHPTDAGGLVMGTNHTSYAYEVVFDNITSNDSERVPDVGGGVIMPIFMSNQLRGMGV